MPTSLNLTNEQTKTGKELFHLVTASLFLLPSSPEAPLFMPFLHSLAHSFFFHLGAVYSSLKAQLKGHLFYEAIVDPSEFSMSCFPLCSHSSLYIALA